MKKRLLIFGTMVSAAIGVPFVATEGPKNVPDVGSFWSSGEERPADVGSSEYQIPANPLNSGERKVGASQAAPLEGMPVYDLAEVFRFDITPDWVYQRWSRKSTALADLEFHGIRVPLVTGTRTDDLAGSLTYYFNAEGGLEKIVFRGRTGNAGRLVQLLTARYNLRVQRPRVQGEMLYELRWNARPMSQLRIRPTAVQWSDTQHAAYDVSLELNRPGAPRYVREAEIHPAAPPSVR